MRCYHLFIASFGLLSIVEGQAQVEIGDALEPCDTPSCELSFWFNFTVCRQTLSEADDNNNFLLEPVEYTRMAVMVLPELRQRGVTSFEQLPQELIDAFRELGASSVDVEGYDPEDNKPHEVRNMERICTTLGEAFVLIRRMDGPPRTFAPTASPVATSPLKYWGSNETCLAQLREADIDKDEVLTRDEYIALAAPVLQRVPDDFNQLPSHLIVTFVRIGSDNEAMSLPGLQLEPLPKADARRLAAVCEELDEAFYVTAEEEGKPTRYQQANEGESNSTSIDLWGTDTICFSILSVSDKNRNGILELEGDEFVIFVNHGLRLGSSRLRFFEFDELPTRVKAGFWSKSVNTTESFGIDIQGAGPEEQEMTEKRKNLRKLCISMADALIDTLDLTLAPTPSPSPFPTNVDSIWLTMEACHQDMRTADTNSDGYLNLTEYIQFANLGAGDRGWSVADGYPSSLSDSFNRVSMIDIGGGIRASLSNYTYTVGTIEAQLASLCNVTRVAITNALTPSPSAANSSFENESEPVDETESPSEPVDETESPSSGVLANGEIGDTGDVTAAPTTRSNSGGPSQFSSSFSVTLVVLGGVVCLM